MNNVYDLITEKEHETIRNYIRMYGPRYKDQVIRHTFAPNDIILKEWAKAKEVFLNKIFKDSLIFTKTITVEIALAERVKHLREKIYNNEQANYYYQQVLLNRKDYFYIDNVSRMIDWTALKNEGTDTYWFCTQFFDWEHLVLNHWNQSYSFEIPLVNGKTIKVQPGTKVSRVLSKLNSYFPNENYDKFRCICSEIDNYKTTDLKVSLSIHPLDYMTMSDNEEGWTSCMCWADDCGGEYHAGTVEMMNSSSVIVAYVSSDKNNMSSFDIEWNSKKWRSLFICDPEFIRSVSAYPYENDALTKEILYWIHELYAEVGINLDRTIMSCPRESTPYGERYNSVFETELMYNDTLHRPGFYIGELPTSTYIYSGPCTCIWCGAYRDDSCTEKVTCDECEWERKCSCCGTTESNIDGELYYSERTNEYLCPDCYWERFFECDGCHNEEYRDEGYCIDFYYNRAGGISWRNRSVSKIYCYNCWIKAKEKLGELLELNEDGIYCVYLEDLNPELRDYFDF